MNGIILFSHSPSGTVLEAFSDLNVRRLLSAVTYTGWMEAQFTENPFLAHETLNRELYVLFKLCNYLPNLIPGWIFSPVRGQYSSKVHKLGWEFVLPTFLIGWKHSAFILDTILNTHCLETRINKLIISVPSWSLCCVARHSWLLRKWPLILFYFRCKL